MFCFFLQINIIRNCLRSKFVFSSEYLFSSLDQFEIRVIPTEVENLQNIFFILSDPYSSSDKSIMLCVALRRVSIPIAEAPLYYVDILLLVKTNV